MSKFNLDTYQKINGDDPIDHKLQQEHSEAPNEISEKQLEDGRVIEKESLIENLLEESRKASTDVLTEKSLDDSKSKLVTHRNPSAFEGNINKLEEQRIASEPVEDEKYEDASATPKKLRWWEAKPGKDGLKLAQDENQTKTAGYDDELDDNQGRYDDDQGDYDNDQLDFGRDRFEDTRNDEDPFGDDNSPIDEVNDNDFEIEEFPSIETTPMKETGFNVLNMGGTPMANGSIDVKVDTENYDQDLLTNDIIDFIRTEHPEVTVLPESLDFSKLSDGEVSYIVSVPKVNKVKDDFHIKEVDLSDYEASSRSMTKEADLKKKQMK